MSKAFALEESGPDFPRVKKPLMQLPLIPLIDVVFMLIVFFMLTTSFMRIESMEILLPSSGAKGAAEKKDIVRIVLLGDNQIMFGQRKVDEAELKKTLTTIFEGNPNQRVLLMPDQQVSTQRLVTMMDMIYLTGGKSLFVKDLPNIGKQAPANLSPGEVP